MIEIIVPATSANIGPGFDCLGISLNLYNKFYIEEIDSGLEIYGCEDDFKNEDNLVYKSMKYFFDNVECDYIPKGIKIGIKSDIPICRGLGSSASCIVAGVMAANYLSRCNLDKNKLLEIASNIEGHPDNVAPALFGNMIISIVSDGKVHYDTINIPDELKFCAMIPDFRLSTSKSRGVLPKHIPHYDGVFNIGRVSLLISSLINKNFDMLKLACQDKIHQNYRGSLIKNYDEVLNYCYDSNCMGVFLSGAGPTIMSIIKDEDFEFSINIDSYLKSLNCNWDVINLKCDNKGALLNIL